MKSLVSIVRRRYTLILSTILGVLVLSFLGTILVSHIVDNRKTILPEVSWRDYFGDLDYMAIDNLLVEQKEIASDFSESRGMIFLTFDDGPSEHTEKLLDILKKHETKATFFVTGRGEDAVIKREYDEGHTVALHTWSHDYSIIYRSVDSFFSDLALVAERVKRITGNDAKIIRFPGGASNLVSTKYDNGIKIMSFLTQEVIKRGYAYFDWNIDSNDAGNIDSADIVYENVTSHLKNGTNIVLQHDTKDFSIDAVERIIEYGKSQGYIFEALTPDSPAIRHRTNN